MPHQIGKIFGINLAKLGKRINKAGLAAIAIAQRGRTREVTAHTDPILVDPRTGISKGRQPS